MNADPWPEQLRRLNEMANEGSGAIDLSPRDCQAIKAALERFEELEEENQLYKDAMSWRELQVEERNAQLTQERDAALALVKELQPAARRWEIMKTRFWRDWLPEGGLCKLFWIASPIPAQESDTLEQAVDRIGEEP